MRWRAAVPGTVRNIVVLIPHCDEAARTRMAEAPDRAPGLARGARGPKFCPMVNCVSGSVGQRFPCEGSHMDWATRQNIERFEKLSAAANDKMSGAAFIACWKPNTGIGVPGAQWRRVSNRVRSWESRPAFAASPGGGRDMVGAWIDSREPLAAYSPLQISCVSAWRQWSILRSRAGGS